MKKQKKKIIPIRNRTAEYPNGRTDSYDYVENDARSFCPQSVLRESAPIICNYSETIVDFRPRINYNPCTTRRTKLSARVSRATRLTGEIVGVHRERALSQRASNPFARGKFSKFITPLAQTRKKIIAARNRVRALRTAMSSGDKQS